MELKIKEAERIDIIKRIIQNPLFLGDYNNEDGGILPFLEMTWDLRSMPSEDSRYTNARDDIWKHIVVNDDITIEQLFLDRLPSSYKNDEKFVTFINSTVHPSVINDEGKRDKMIDFINTLLVKFSHKLVITDYFGAIPVYTFRDNTNTMEMPKGIKSNTIRFYKSTNRNRTYPSFFVRFQHWME